MSNIDKAGAALQYLKVCIPQARAVSRNFLSQKSMEAYFRLLRHLLLIKRNAHQGLPAMQWMQILLWHRRTQQRRNHFAICSSLNAALPINLSLVDTGIAVTEPCQHGNAELLVWQRETASG